jgi:NAD(P)-dependent dehydrogenase (short-subunit alcohol dehydrogenase family)
MGSGNRGWAPARQDGRRFAITGATSGLGLETARALAGQGAEVVLAVRNTAKGEDVARAMTGKVEVRRLDLADLSSVRAFAADLGPIDVLVNNAGVMAVPYALTVDGFETQLATNHLGHFALTNLLLPTITDRVVVVSSDVHPRGEVDLDDLNWALRPYKPFRAYAASKLENLLFMLELDRRLREIGSPTRVVGAHPGSTATAITANTGNAFKTWVGSWGHRLAGMSPRRGALTTLYAATMDLPGNTYIGPDGPMEMRGWPAEARRSPKALDETLARGLWERSEAMTGVRFPL